jgi:hypothetical protein
MFGLMFVFFLVRKKSGIVIGAPSTSKLEKIVLVKY